MRKMNAERLELEKNQDTYYAHFLNVIKSGESLAAKEIKLTEEEKTTDLQNQQVLEYQVRGRVSRISLAQSNSKMT